MGHDVEPKLKCSRRTIKFSIECTGFFLILYFLCDMTRQNIFHHFKSLHQPSICPIHLLASPCMVLLPYHINAEGTNFWLRGERFESSLSRRKCYRDEYFSEIYYKCALFNEYMMRRSPDFEQFCLNWPTGDLRSVTNGNHGSWQQLYFFSCTEPNLWSASNVGR